LNRTPLLPEQNAVMLLRVFKLRPEF